MLMPYLRVRPDAPVFLARSDPARSTKKNLAVINPSSSGPSGCCSRKMVKMACERELLWFIIVDAVVRCRLPRSNRFSICPWSVTSSSVTPYIETDPSFSSLIEIPFSFALHLTISTSCASLHPTGR